MENSKPTTRATTSSLINDVLSNELLLETVFQQFDPSPLPDLKSCRLISKTWKSPATKCVRQFNWVSRIYLKLNQENFRMAVVEEDRDALFTCYSLEDKSATFNELTSSQLESFLLKFTQHIEGLTWAAEFTRHGLVGLDKLVETQSKSLKELKISITGIPSDNPEIISDESTFKLLNLTHLCLSLQPNIFRASFDMTHQHKVLELILRKIPEGKAINIFLMQWQGIGKTISILQQYKQIKNVKALDMTIGFVGEMRSLCRLGPEFGPRLLGINYWAQNVEDWPRFTQEVYEYLCHSGNRLESLEWTSFWFKFPLVMPFLKKLRLRWDFQVDGIHQTLELRWMMMDEQRNHVPIVYPQILYEQIFPQLQELELLMKLPYNFQLDQFRLRFIQPQLPCITLRKLVFGFCGINVIRELSILFPRVTSLRLLHNNFERENSVDEFNYFRDLWGDDNFSVNLEELHIETNFYYQNLKTRPRFEWDSIFSGVGEKRIESISSSMNTRNFKDFQASQIEQRASILNLKSLKKLFITNIFRYRLDPCRCYFTDFSAFCTFGRMEKLEFLHIEKGIRKFTKSALKFLNNLHVVPLPSSAELLRSEDRIEEVFRTGFTYVAPNTTKPVNLLDINFTDEDSKCLDPKVTYRREMVR